MSIPSALSSASEAGGVLRQQMNRIFEVVDGVLAVAFHAVGHAALMKVLRERFEMNRRSIVVDGAIEVAFGRVDIAAHYQAKGLAGSMVIASRLSTSARPVSPSVRKTCARPTLPRTDLGSRLRYSVKSASAALMLRAVSLACARGQ
jgi:hypothetical protein